ncbi:unnamed protein product [Effrenium voratum]|nr:unnamed protein product [Effrenium voratum]
MVKGWNRSVCALAILVASYKNLDLSFAVVHVTIVEADDSAIAFESAAAFATAYSVGKAEAGAALNLLNNIPDHIRDRLWELARTHSMPKFIAHEGIAHGIFNSTYTSATASLVPWHQFLSNNDELLDLLCTRLENDWVSLSTKMRKAWTLRDIETLPVEFGAVSHL